MFDDICAALSVAGWRYDKASNGFVLGKDWVSYEQAMAAYQTAQAGIETEKPYGVSRTLAEVVVRAENDNRDAARDA